MGIQNLHIMLCNRFAFAKVLPKLSCLLLFLCSSFFLHAQATCVNVTDGGTLSGNETGCAKPSFDPGIITNVTIPSGGSGPIEYLWMKTTGDPTAPFNEWSIIPNAKGLSYDPLPIFQTTYYARCSRRFPCSDYNGETNYITKLVQCCEFDVLVNPAAATVCIGTSISLETDISNGAFNWTSNGGSFDNPTSATPVFTATTGGTYMVSVVVTNSDGCEGSATVPITIQSIIANANVTNATCGNADGAISTTVSGGTAPYSYDWGDRFGNTATINGLAVGSYIGIITDSKGCAAAVLGEVSGATNINTNIVVNNASCAGQDGSINLSITGGQAPYIINWDNNLGSSINPTNLSAGTYSVTITDQSGCNKVDAATVLSATNISVTAETSNTSCATGSDGSIVLSVSQGIAPYSYSWSGGVSTGASAQNLSAGTYQVTVLDATGCSAIINRTILAPAPLTANIGAEDACSNSSGTATINVSGGTPGYTYAWNDANNQTTQQAINLAAGTYTATITDRLGCTTTATTTISGGGLLVTSGTTKVSCGGAPNGSIIVYVANGIAPFSYQWNNGLPNVSQIEGLAEGAYTVTVTDAAGCTGSVDTKVAKEDGFSLAVNVEAASCLANGRAVAIVDGPADTYTYRWNDSNNTMTNAAANLAPAIYTVTVTNSAGCSLTAEAEILKEDAFSLAVDVQGTTCKGSNGQATVTVNGPPDSYTYRWNDINNMMSSTATNLAPAIYTVTVTNSQGCSITAEASIIDSSINLSANISATATEICGGTIVNLSTSIQDNQTSYNWSATSGSFDNPSSPTPTYTSTENGTHTITLTIQDKNACQATSTTTIQTFQPAGGTISTSDPTIYCIDDDRPDIINVTLSDAIGIDANWLITDAAGNILQVTNSNTFDFEGIAEGIYFIHHISYNNNLTGDILPNEHINNLTGCFSLSNSIQVERLTGAACNILCTVEGGTLSTPDLTTICVGDGTPDQISVSLLGNTGAASTWIITDNEDTIIDLPAGPVFDFESTSTGICKIWHVSSLYPLSDIALGSSINSLSGCHALSTNSIVVTRSSPVIVDIITPSTTTCRNTPLQLSTSITDATSAFSWTADGATFDDANSGSPTFTPSLSGNYTVSVAVSDGICTSNGVTTIEVPDDLQIAASINPAECVGRNTGGINVTINGGLAPFTYAWADGINTGNMLSNIAAGDYTLTVTDANGCAVTNTLTVPTSTTLSLAVTTTDLLCNGDQTGTINAEVTGGEAPYSYSWDGEEASNELIGLAGGSYQLVVTDAKGCSISEDISVIEPLALEVSTQTSTAICNSGGTAAVVVAGGSGAFNYQWSILYSPDTSSISNLTAGIYTVTISDQNNCTTSASLDVPVQGISQCDLEVTNAITSANGTEGALSMNVIGGNTLRYLWSTGDSTATISGLAAGGYTVTVTDDIGCSCTRTAVLTEPSKIGDYVFEDKNNNGVQDATEEGLRGVLLQIEGTTAEGISLVDEVRTDKEGFYHFLVPAGTYKITALDYLNLKFSPQNVGAEALDSDIDPITLMSELITVQAGEYYLDLDIGLVPTGFCDNLITGGMIGADETICGPSGDPEAMFNISYPTGGSGEIQYLWLTSHKPVYTPDDPDWIEIPDSDHEYYDPPVVAQSTYFVRCARRKACNNYPGETNVVAKEIVDCFDTPSAENLLVSVIDNQIELKWTGNISAENSTFVIERSEDGISYKTISTTKGHMSESYTQYDYMDKAPMIGENYYRIKTVHPVMGYHISNTAMAMLTPKKNMRVTMYPNPIQNEVTVHFLENLGETTILEVANGFGQVIKRLEIDSGTKKYLLDMSNIPGGIYYIKFQNRLLKRYSQKIIKRD